MATERPGIAVDAHGGPVIDPTKNVLDLVEASVDRLNDLREADNRRVDAELAHLKEVGELRAAHSKEMRAAESDRLNSIRQVDVTAVKTEADRALAAIQTLAAQTATNAENLRNALTATAATIAKQTSDTVSQLIERIAALEKSSYEGVGKQRVSDPAMEDLVRQVKALGSAQQQGSGFKAGQLALFGGLVALFSLIGSVVYIVAELKPAPAPQVTYTAPANPK